MITLYWAAHTRAFRCVWMLEELECDYDLQRVDLSNPGADARFLAASPLAKVPALAMDGVQLADSAAICLYLGDRFGALAPALEDPSRGRYLFWMMFVPGVLEPAVIEKMTGAEPNRRQHGWADYDSMWSCLGAALADGPWLMGEKFLAADILVGSTLSFLREMSVLPADDRIDGYVARCTARPAYARARARETETGASCC